MVEIKTNIIRRVNTIYDSNLILLVLLNARDKTAQNTPKRINNKDELYENYDLGSGNDASKKKAIRELFIAEYLLDRNTNLIITTTATQGTLIAADLDSVLEVDDYSYSVVLAPYLLEDTDTVKAGHIIDKLKKLDVEIFLDMDPTKNTYETIATAIKTKATAEYSHKVSLFLGSGIPIDFSTGYTIENYDGTKYLPTDVDAPYYGILGSAIAAVKKVHFLANNTPWLPVAGEQTGVIRELGSIYKRYKASERTTIQSKDLNLLSFKAGVGHLFVSQNTLARVGVDKINPLIRSHVVTSALWIKKRIKSITERIIFMPHNDKTYNSWEASIRSFLTEIQGQSGITKYFVLTGSSVMTQQNINEGTFKGVVTYHPINVIESAKITLNILETADTDVVVEGV